MNTMQRTISMLRLPEVESRVGLKKSTLYAMIVENRFPAPVSIGARAVAWPSITIDAWLEKKIDDSRKLREP